MFYIEVEVLYDILNFIIARFSIWIILEKNKEEPNVQFIETCNAKKEEIFELFKTDLFKCSSEEIKRLTEKYGPLSKKIHKLEYENKKYDIL